MTHKQIFKMFFCRINAVIIVQFVIFFCIFVLFLIIFFIIFHTLPVSEPQMERVVWLIRGLIQLSLFQSLVDFYDLLIVIAELIDESFYQISLRFLLFSKYRRHFGYISVINCYYKYFHHSLLFFCI